MLCLPLNTTQHIDSENQTANYENISVMMKKNIDKVGKSGILPERFRTSRNDSKLDLCQPTVGALGQTTGCNATMRCGYV